MNTMKRGLFTAKINEQNFPLDVFFLSALRRIKPDEDGNPQLQVEVAQKKNVNGRVSILASLNKSNRKFRDNGTMLFNWMLTTPVDIVKNFPDLKMTVKELEAFAKGWTDKEPTGPESDIIPLLIPTNKIVIEGKTYEPVISVTEELESNIAGGFYTKRSKRYEENVHNALELGYNAMKTNEDENGNQEDILDAETGQRVFRFTRVEVVGSREANDKIIPNKVPRSLYNEGAIQTNSKEQSFQDIHKEIVGTDTI